MLLILALAGCGARAESAAHAVWEPLDLPVSVGGTTYHLDGLMLRLDDHRPHPLAVLNHGSPRDADDRALVGPAKLQNQMLEFVRRGWTVVSFTRRGYGKSDGGWAETYGPCRNPDYVAAGRAGAADIAGVIADLKTDPRIDKTRITSVGVSAGGLATVALTADPPAGLVAAISFAGGRGSSQSDEVCAEPRLVSAFAGFGRTSRVPMLWVYAANDHFFAPALAQKLLSAFTETGGQATFVAADAFGDEGHFLFSRKGIPVWAPLVDRFLATRGLTLVASPIDVAGPDIAPPPGLSAGCRETFAKYLVSAPHKAFAAGKTGCGFATGRADKASAAAAALDYCRKDDDGCSIVNLDDASVR